MTAPLGWMRAPSLRSPAARRLTAVRTGRRASPTRVTFMPSALATYPRPAMADDSAGVAGARCAAPAPSATAPSPSCTRCCCARARHELRRRRSALSHVAATELDDLAMQAADDALVAVLAKLDTFRGASRFTTWAYKFALLEAGVKARRRAWQGREIALERRRLAGVRRPRRLGARGRAETGELLRAIRDGRRRASSPPTSARCSSRWRCNEVPIDVLAERARHDARRPLQDPARRAAPAARRALRPRPGRRHHERTRPRASCSPGCSAPPGPRSAARSASSGSTSTSTPSCRRATPTRAIPGMAAHLEGCPACREDHESLRDARQPRAVVISVR